MRIHQPIEIQVANLVNNPVATTRFHDLKIIKTLHSDLSKQIMMKAKTKISIPDFMPKPKKKSYSEALLFENITWTQLKRLTTLTLSVKLHSSYRMLHNNPSHLNRILTGLQFMNTSRMYEWIKHDKDSSEDPKDLTSVMKCNELNDGTKYLLLSTYADMYYIIVWSNSRVDDQYRFTVLTVYKNKLWEEVRTKHLNMFGSKRAVNLTN